VCVNKPEWVWGGPRDDNQQCHDANTFTLKWTPIVGPRNKIEKCVSIGKTWTLF
jgi:hypothetical protein